MSCCVKGLIKVYEELEEAEQMGLILNCKKKKSKYMIVSALESRRKLEDLHIGNKIFEGVSNFKYFGNVIDNENKIISCVMERIQAGNKAYYANLHLFKSKLISRNLKKQIYQTLVQPVVTYGGETWTPTLTDENALRIFERKILRKIYGPVLENGEIRIRYNEELNELIKGEDIGRFIKAQKLQWLGHVERMNETPMP
jgi:hypothetical protein